MQDLTGEVAGIVRASGVRSGLVHIFNVGSTGAIGTIEFEPGLEQALPAMLDKLFPPSRDYGHEQACGRGIRWQRRGSSGSASRWRGWVQNLRDGPMDPCPMIPDEVRNNRLARATKDAEDL